MSKLLFIIICCCLTFTSCQSNQLNKNITLETIIGDMEEGNMNNTVDYDTTKSVEELKPTDDISETFEKDIPKAVMVNRTREEYTIQPDHNNIIKSTIHYQYLKDQSYAIFVAVNKLTDITLRKSEQLSSEIVIGNAAKFIIGNGQSYEDGSEINHIYLTPLEPGIETNMIIPTNERTYYLNIITYKYTNMVKVKWSYPAFDMKRLFHNKKNVLPDINLSNINFSYEYEFSGRRKNIPSWMPTIVFDDGTRTFIRINNLTRLSALPVLYSRLKNKKLLINYRIQGLYYIIDNVYTHIYMTTDEKNSNNVVVVKRAIR